VFLPFILGNILVTHVTSRI